jgi:hypothetical protein
MKKLLFLMILTTVALFSCKQPNKNVWKIVNTKDEFGDITKESAILATFEGTMDNSATSGSKLIVSLQVEKDSTIYMTFYEYGHSPAVVFDSYTTNMEMQIKLSTGKMVPIAVMPFQSYMLDIKHQLFNLLITQKQPLKILFKATFNPSTVYTFEINPDNFTEIIKGYVN